MPLGGRGAGNFFAGMKRGSASTAWRQRYILEMLYLAAAVGMIGNQNRVDLHLHWQVARLDICVACPAEPAHLVAVNAEAFVKMAGGPRLHLDDYQPRIAPRDNVALNLAHTGIALHYGIALSGELFGGKILARSAD